LKRTAAAGSGSQQAGLAPVRHSADDEGKGSLPAAPLRASDDDLCRPTQKNSRYLTIETLSQGEQ
jgi:hypothetical protein